MSLLTIINAFYLVVILSFLLIGLFIIYHIIRYSLSQKIAFLTLLVFLSVFGTLVFSNIILFFSLKFDQIIPSFFF